MVTGATGFTGGALARRLHASGHPVRAFVRPGSIQAEALEAEGIELIEGDVRDAAAVAAAARGVCQIYHLAAVFRTAGHPNSYYWDVNACGTENVLAAARKHGIERTIHCSTVGVHGHVKEVPSNEDAPFNPGDIYQVTKLEGERLALKAFDLTNAKSIPGTIVRPAGIYGIGDLRFLKLFRAIARKRFVMLGSGETFYHLTYIDDLVDGLILCANHPAALGRAFIICGDDYVTLNRLVLLIASELGVKPPSIRLPIWPVMAAADVCEALCRPLGVEPPLHRRRAEFFVKDRAFTSQRARSELGYRSQVSLVEGIRRTALWYREKGLL